MQDQQTVFLLQAFEACHKSLTAALQRLVAEMPGDCDIACMDKQKSSPRSLRPLHQCCSPDANLVSILWKCVCGFVLTQQYFAVQMGA